VQNESLVHFLIFLVILLSYFLYQESEENARFYELLVKSEETIDIQSEAIASQKKAIKQLETAYYLLYNKYNMQYSPTFQ